MTKPDQRNLTDEVKQALSERGHVIPGDGPMAQPPVPEGSLRYHIAVEDNVQGGVAPKPVVAAVLRSVADELDPPKKGMR
jgi:hypothetical protein